MRRLLLIRHAKSSWKYPELDDHDRPLNARGKRDIATVSHYLKAHEPHLDKLFSSTAVRALELATEIGQCLQVGVEKSRAVYTFESGSLASAIRQVDNEFEQIAMVGHNPAITDLVNHLTKAGIANVPTSGVAAITYTSTNWAELSGLDCELEYFATPKMFK